MDNDLKVNSFVIIPDAELIVTASRASGPGGQHVNKTSSRITLRFNIGASSAFTDDEKARIIKRLQYRLVGDDEILINVDSERSQLQNRRIARERLAQILKDALVVHKKRIATKPSVRSKTKRIEGKKLRSMVKKLRKRIND